MWAVVLMGFRIRSALPNMRFAPELELVRWHVADHFDLDNVLANHGGWRAVDDMIDSAVIAGGLLENPRAVGVLDLS